MKRSVHGILFDLGDTLLDFGQVNVNREFEKGAQLAYDYLQGLNQPLPPFAKYHRQQFRAVRWHYFISHLRGRDFNSLDLMDTLAERLGHNLTREQLVELAWLWYEPVSRCATLEPGLREMLIALREEGLKLGLLSNTFIPPEVLDRHLEQVALLELLPVRVYSCQHARRKPHPRIFAEAAEKLGLPAEELVFVGDSLKADILGANRAGMISVLKDPTGAKRHWRIKPAHRVRGVVELPAVMKLYNG